jgi:signal peptidase II
LTAKNRSLLLPYSVGALVILLDQYTKHLVRQNVPLNVSWNPIMWLEPIVTLTHVRNTGAAFGLFPELSVVFVLVALAVIVGIIIYYRQLTQVSLLLRIALGLQLGGATGNLIDRLTLGYVTDFVDFRVWPVFNVADSAVVVGTALLAYYALFAGEPACGDTPDQAMPDEVGPWDIAEQADGADCVKPR